MSWDGDQGGSDPLPVDSLVKGIRNVLEDFQDICKDFRGQEKHCCDTVRSCYGNIDSTLTSVRLQGAIKQDVHRACRRIDDQLHAINICVGNKLRSCSKVDTRDLEVEYEEFKQKFKTEFDKHCTNLPPERTTVKTSSPPVRTTTTPFVTTTSSESITSIRYIKTTTASVPTSTSTIKAATEDTITTTKPPDQETTAKDRVQTTSENTIDNVTQSTTEKTFIITDTDTEPPTNEVSTKSAIDENTYGSNAITRINPTNTEPKPPPTTNLTFTTSPHSSTGSLLPGTTAGLQHPPSDNTVIIVSAVCSGVVLLIALVVFLIIRYKKKREGEDSGDCHCQKVFTCKWFQRNKSQPNEQDGEIYTEIDEAFMQAVYEFDKKKDPHPNLKNRVQTNAHVNVCYSAGVNDDGVISSKISHGPTLQLSTRNLRQVSKQNEYQTSKDLKANLDKSKQTGFVLSHPTFTDPRGTDVVSDEYVQISEKYESIETVYDQPTHHKSDFPKVDETDDTDRNEYDHIVAHEVEAEDDDEPDYVNSPVSQSNDHLYENELSSYEITQSRF